MSSRDREASAALGDVAAGPATPGDVARFDQAGHRLPHRRPGHAESRHQLALGRQLGARRQLELVISSSSSSRSRSASKLFPGISTAYVWASGEASQQMPSPRGLDEPGRRRTEPRAAGRRRWRCQSCSPTHRHRSRRRPGRCSRSIPRRSPDQ